MAQKKGLAEQEVPVPLQAVLLAYSFTQKFRPITLERPKVLLPLANVPMIEYALAWLESVGVAEVFVFCSSHANQVKDYLQKPQWLGQSRIKVDTIESHDSISAGDALRLIYDKIVIIMRVEDQEKKKGSPVLELVEILLKLEEMCLESAKGFTPIFSSILQILYEQDIVTEDAIMA